MRGSDLEASSAQGFLTWFCVLQLQIELDQEYQDKFRRLPVEIQEFVQDSAACKAQSRNSGGGLPVSTETLWSETGSSDKVFDTTL